MRSFLASMRRASVALSRRPLLTIAVAGSIALGVGAVTAVFVLFDAALLRPQPLIDYSGLVNVHRVHQGRTFGAFSRGAWAELRERGASIADLAAFTGVGASLRSGGASGAELVACQLVSANYLEVLGVRPVLGRSFTAADDRAGAEPVVLLGHGLWERRFAGDPTVVGRNVTIGGRAFTVIGVLPAGFRGHFAGFAFDIWAPLAAVPAIAAGTDAFEVIGRRVQGVSLEAARVGLGAALRDVGRGRPEVAGDGIDVRVATPLDDSLRRPVTVLLTVLLGIGFAVLAIATINVAGLLLMRAESRRRELAVRRALGAAGADLASLLIAESAVLCALGGAAGLLVAALACRGFERFNLSTPLPLVLELRVTGRVAVFAFVVTLFAAALATWAPLLAVRQASVAGALRSAAANISDSGRLRRALVGGQLACALILLVLGALFGRALARGKSGVPVQSLCTAELLWPVVGKDATAGQAFYAAILEEAGALPGVARAALIRRLPFAGLANSLPVSRGEDGPPALNPAAVAELNVVSPGGFSLLGEPLLDGRDFDGGDRAGSNPVAVVSRGLANALWPGGSPVGRDVWVGDPAGGAPRRFQIVGMTADIGLGGARERAALYLPLAQSPTAGRMTLILDSSRPTRELAGALAAIAARLEPELPAPLVQPMSQALAGALLPQRLAGATASVLGSVGVTLALAGVYAVAGASVARRRRELAIRLAVGARPADLFGLVLREQARLVLWGGTAGLALAVAAGQAVRGFLLGGSALDPASLLVATSSLVLVVLLASLPSARQAAFVDPARLLRD